MPTTTAGRTTVPADRPRSRSPPAFQAAVVPKLRKPDQAGPVTAPAPDGPAPQSICTERMEFPVIMRSIVLVALLGSLAAPTVTSRGT